MLCEWKKYKKIKFHAEFLNDFDKTVEDCCFSRDDMLVVELKADGGFIFTPVEKIESEKHLDHEGDEEMKDLLDDPKTMEFLKIPLVKAMKATSNRGKCGLSNLGNTCFMNSALQCLSNTTELTKYFLYGLYEGEVNYKNALGTQGRLVKAYAKLMTEMWVDGGGRTAPWDVKKAIGTVAQQFSGFA
jgi:ubiquitin C-terminal hydrolase